MIRLGPRALQAAVAALIISAVACQSKDAVLSGQAIVTGIPWADSEVATYRLADGDDVIGTGVLTIAAEDGTYRFTQAFENDEFEDTAVAVTDAQTMAPSSAERVIDGPEGERRWEAAYAHGMLSVFQESAEGEREDEISVPTRSYDSWTDLFLWRTIDFREGYEAAYADVLSATLAKPQVISQELRVTGKETVEVPAGTFEAWRLKINAPDGEQTAWYADTEARPLVRYDNGSFVFELESLQ